MTAPVHHTMVISSLFHMEFFQEIYILAEENMTAGEIPPTRFTGNIKRLYHDDVYIAQPRGLPFGT